VASFLYGMCFTTKVTRSSSTPDPVAIDGLPCWQDIGIVDLNAQGEGVGRHDGQVVFVPFTIPGEIVDVQLTSRRPTFARGEAQTLRLPAPTRAKARCEQFGKCGGCQYQHMAYPAQPDIAAASVLGNIRKMLRNWDLPEPELISCPEPYGYRTQTRLQFQRIEGAPRLPGYVDLDGAVLPVSTCPVLHPVLQQLLTALQQPLAQEAMQQQLLALDMRFVTMQSNRDGSECALLFHTFELLNVKKNWDRELWGECWLALQEQVPALVGLVIDNGQTDVGFGQNFTSEPGSLAPLIPLGAFKQNNAFIEDAVYELVLRWLDPQAGETGIDAYCGRGELTARLAAATPGGQIVGIESAPVWFDQGHHINQDDLPGTLAQRIRFVQHTVEQWLPGQPTPSWMVCNPPRKGMEPPVLDWLKASGPERWIYISCNPATFARDCTPLTDHYRVTQLACLDMFPQTSKMELVALFERCPAPQAAD